MTETSKAIISVTAIVSVIAGFMAIFNSGVLDPLNPIIIYEYTLPQLIWLTLIVMGPAVIIAGVWAGLRSPKDVLKDTEQYLKQVGMSPGQLADIKKSAAAKLNELLPAPLQVHAARAKKGIRGAWARWRAPKEPSQITELEEFPLPGQVAQALRETFYVYQAAVSEASSGQVQVSTTSQPLAIVTARPASAVGLEPVTAYSARRLRWIIILVIIAIAASIIAWLWGK